MKLVIFDIDGTLTDTVGVDDACYLALVRETFGVATSAIDWEEFTHVTDSYVASALMRRHRGRDAEEAEFKVLELRLEELLREQAVSAPHLFAPIPGALVSFERLRAEPGWVVALASGAWRRSGELKLATAGFDVAGVPAAYSNDAAERTGIVLTSLGRARTRYARPLFEKVVAVGDGPWDVATARALGLGFVGVARSEARRVRLAAEGATTLLADYLDHEALVAALEAAAVPSTR